MSGTVPVAVWAVQVPPGDELVSGVAGYDAMFRVTMAAIDPSASPVFDVNNDKKPPRATLKMVRVPALDDEDSEDDSDDDDYDLLNGEEESSSEDDEDKIGGPSDPNKLKKLKKAAKSSDDSGDDEEADSEAEELEAKTLLAKLKGKAKATGDQDDDEDEDDDGIELEQEETVICTLDPEKQYQQPLDLVIGEGERVFFKVSGTHSVYLTGNYVVPADFGMARPFDEESDDEEDDYDLSPEEAELMGLDMDEDDGEESDELDELDDPRVMEVDTEEDDEEPPKLIKANEVKGKNKRAAEESDEEGANLDDIMAKSLKPAEPATNGEAKLSKKEKKALKKLKKNNGEAEPVAAQSAAAKKDTPASKEPTANGDKTDKKVQFAKNLEQGPTPSPNAKKTDTSGKLGVKTVQGVQIDDKKLGSGPLAKKGDRVGVRYIGKLNDPKGKVFDANKKGEPFKFKVGDGQVIKGMDIGVTGMAVGGERRVTIPGAMGYGKKGNPPDIPGNSTLVFDLKLIDIK